MLHISSPLTHSVPRSPHLFDSQIVNLGVNLVSSLRKILDMNLISPWDLSDILEYVDLLLHANPSDRQWNKDVMLVGTSFSQKVLVASDKMCEKATKDLMDYFRVLWETYKSNIKTAKKLLGILKRGWWVEKSIDELSTAVERGKYEKNWSIFATNTSTSTFSISTTKIPELTIDNKFELDLASMKDVIENDEKKRKLSPSGYSTSYSRSAVALPRLSVTNSRISNSYNGTIRATSFS